MKPVREHTGHSTKQHVSSSGMAAATRGRSRAAEVERRRCETEKGEGAVVISYSKHMQKPVEVLVSISSQAVSGWTLTIWAGSIGRPQLCCGC